MASLQRTLDRKMEETRRQVVELLHDTPLPSLDDVVDDISVIKSFVKDIKAEIKHIESMLPNLNGPTNVSDESNGDDGESKPGVVSRYLREKLADTLEKKWKPRATGQWEGSAMEDFLNKLRSNERLGVLDYLTFLSLVYFDSQWPELVQSSTDPLPAMAGVRDNLRIYMSELHNVTRDLVEQGNQWLENAIQTSESTITTVLTAEIGNLERLLRQTNGSNNTWFKSIYDKVTECCAIDRLENILSLLTVQSDTLDRMFEFIRAGGSPAQLGQMGAIISGVKALSAQVADIRRLL